MVSQHDFSTNWAQKCKVYHKRTKPFLHVGWIFLLRPDRFFFLTFVFVCGSSRPTPLSSPPSALPSLGARLSGGGVALLFLLLLLDQVLLLGQERVDRKHRYRLRLFEMTQHITCDQQEEVGESQRAATTQHFLSLDMF